MTRNIPVPTASTEKPERPKPISKKVRTGIDLMVSGDAKDITAAAKRVGLSREHLSRELRKPHIAQVMRDKTLANLSINAMKAGATKVRLLDSENGMVADRASTFVLGVAGIAPTPQPSVSVNVNIRAGYVIDLTEPNDGEPMKIISP
ncbi:hypothetical protein I3J27_18365 [Bradyrhizobium xenonodulans]|uniref:Uncharacterized protein n=1 Tax=Bradyrhizobium xenonodulans TaxID=2736875 RepID=A0ABY7MV50_9BRAD|nr:hypothetical protein [Bradyrhizobium xenonodulans]WBL82297.1 hypothetical protein I3J27_18365 [Bradyrhizobium xenonodulans]